MWGWAASCDYVWDLSMVVSEITVESRLVNLWLWSTALHVCVICFNINFMVVENPQFSTVILECGIEKHRYKNKMRVLVLLDHWPVTGTFKKNKVVINVPSFTCFPTIMSQWVSMACPLCPAYNPKMWQLHQCNPTTLMWWWYYVSEMS